MYEIPRIFRPLPIIAWMLLSMLTGVRKYASLQNIHKKIIKLRKLVALFTFEMGVFNETGLLVINFENKIRDLVYINELDEMMK